MLDVKFPRRMTTDMLQGSFSTVVHDKVVYVNLHNEILVVVQTMFGGMLLHFKYLNIRAHQ